MTSAPSDDPIMNRILCSDTTVAIMLELENIGRYQSRGSIVAASHKPLRGLASAPWPASVAQRQSRESDGCCISQCLLIDYFSLAGNQGRESICLILEAGEVIGARHVKHFAVSRNVEH